MQDSSDDIKNCRTWSLEKLWNFISSEKDVEQSTINKAKNGIRIKVHVVDLINSNFIAIKPKKGKVRIKTGWYKQDDIYDEIDDRRKVIMEWIEENYPEVQIAKPRIEEEESEKPRDQKVTVEVKTKQPDDEDEEEEQVTDEYDVIKETMQPHVNGDDFNMDYVIANRTLPEDRVTRKSRMLTNQITYFLRRDIAFEQAKHTRLYRQDQSKALETAKKNADFIIKRRDALVNFLDKDVHTINVISRARGGLVIRSILKGIFPKADQEKKHSMLERLNPFGRKGNEDLE